MAKKEIKTCLYLVRIYLFFCLILFNLNSSSWTEQVTDQTPLSKEKYLLTPERQFQLFQKILAFERTWKKRSEPELTLAILYEESYELSLWAKEDLMAAASPAVSIEGIPVRLIEIPLDEKGTWPQLLSQEKIIFLYIAPLRPTTIKKQIKNVLAHCRKNNIGTFTGEVAYVEFGVAIGLGLENQNPHVFINLGAAREQGLEFSSQLLRMVSIK